MPAFYLDTVKLTSYNQGTLTGFVQDSIERVSLFYTKNGIFTVQGGKLYKVTVDNERVDHVEWNGVPITVDHSTEVLTHVSSQIPNDYFVRRLEVVNYKNPGNNHAHLVITYEKDSVVDAFFKCNNDISTPMLQTTIDTFLSNLN